MSVMIRSCQKKSIYFEKMFDKSGGKNYGILENKKKTINSVVIIGFHVGVLVESNQSKNVDVQFFSTTSGPL